MIWRPDSHSQLESRSFISQINLKSDNGLECNFLPNNIQWEVYYLWLKETEAKNVRYAHTPNTLWNANS